MLGILSWMQLAEGQEACGELGNSFIFQGPATNSGDQIEIIENLIAQKVDAICITANDFDALVPVLQKAKETT